MIVQSLARAVIVSGEGCRAGTYIWCPIDGRTYRRANAAKTCKSERFCEFCPSMGLPVVRETNEQTSGKIGPREAQSSIESEFILSGPLHLLG